MVDLVIGVNTYDVYADVATADAYLLADILYSSTWCLATADAKSAAIVSATRYLDSKEWQGEKTSGAQALDWPRSGITDVSSAAVPQEIIDSCILLAAGAIVDSSSLSNSSTVNNVKRAKAGSAEVENFRQTSREIAVFTPGIQEMIGKWLAGASGGLTGVVSGNTCESAFDDDPFSVQHIS